MLRNTICTAVSLLVILSFVPGFSVFGQSGPGGLGDNTGTSNLVFWVKADAGVLNAGATAAANSESVSTWQDQSGYGYNAITGPTSPTFVLSNAAFGGLPTLSFSGTAGSNYMFVEDDADEAPQLDNTSELAIFYVFNSDDNSNLGGHLSKRDGNNSQQSYVFFENGGLIQSRISANNDAGVSVSSSTTYINSLTYSGSQFQHFLNQSSGGTVSTVASIPNNNSDLHIGTLNAGDTRNLDGDFAEIIIFRQGLTVAELIVVETYLASKYGISLPSDFWDEATYAAYDNEIAGIGQHTDGTVASSATSGLLTIADGDARANGDWLFFGHDEGDFATFTTTEVIAASSFQRLAREWVINETNEMGNVVVSIKSDDIPASGLPNPTYSILVDTDGDADFTDATAFSMTLTDGSYQVSLDLNEGDHIALAVEAGDDTEVWYSYISGNWSEPGSWTLDGAISALFVNPDSKTPGVGDSVVIQSGRAITADINDIVVQRTSIIGTLDLAASTGHNLGNLDGSGTLRLSGNGGTDNYPTAFDESFYDATEGGIVEYYGGAITLDQRLRYNNLILNLDNSSDIASVTADSLIVFGNLTLTSGDFTFNDNSATNSVVVEVYGDMTVSTGSTVNVGTANARHELNLYGDFQNQGAVNFTNQSTVLSAEATDGIVDVNLLSPSADQSLSIENTADFYRIEINKGVDDTYIADISATNASFFNIYGPAVTGLSGAQGSTNDNALGLIYGTVKIGENITIPRLNNATYNVFEGARLWVNGGTVLHNDGNALVPYGEILVSAGTLEVLLGNGLATRDAGQLTIEGGTVNLYQFRTSITGASAQGGLVMSGGVLNIQGISTRSSYHLLNLTYDGNVFNMSGGTINISDVNTSGAIYINSADENINVTGGTINIDITNDNDAVITSRAPFFNMNITQSGAAATGVAQIAGATTGEGGGTTTLTPDNLSIINDLRVDNSAGNGTAFDANNFDLNITGALTIDNGAVVDLTGMELIFDGSGNSNLAVNTGATLTLDSLVISKDTETSTLTLDNGASPAVTINNYLNVNSGNINPAAFDISLLGNLNIADSISFAAQTGKLILNGTGAQTITSTGGVVADLEVNNTNGISLEGDISLDTLTMTDGVFDIDTYALTLTGGEIQGSLFGTTKMIETAGNVSDGGLSTFIAQDDVYTYPLGVSGKFTPVDLDITLTNSNTGEVQIRPVDAELATTNLAGTNLLGYYWNVDYDQFGTVDLPNVNSLAFTFDATDVSAGTPNSDYVAGKVLDESPFTRSYEGDVGVQVTASTITFDGLAADNDGTGTRSGFEIEKANYTAGDIDRFEGTPLIYYTKDDPSDGGFNFLLEWDNPAVWVRSDQLTDLNGDLVIDEKDWHRGDNPDSPDFPGAGDIAVIGFIPWEDPNITNRGLAHHLNLNNEVEECAELIFTQMTDVAGDPVARTDIFFALRPSILITGASGQLNADVVRGEGQFFIRFGGDPDFSSVDLGDFVSQDSSIFFYEAASNRTYNNAPAEVPNLILGTSSWGTNDLDIQFSTDVSINQNLEILGNANLVLNNGVSGDIAVQRNLIMFETDAVPLPCCGGSSLPSGGGAQLLYPNSSNARSVTVVGDIIMENSGGVIEVESPGTTPLDHTLTVQGNIEQNTTTGGGLQLFTASGEDRITLNLTGEGTHAYTLTSGADPQLYRLLVNKGSDTTSTFTFNSNFTLNGDNTVSPQALELQSGKLVFNNSSINLELTNGLDYAINSSSGLEVTQGTVTATNANIILNGLLRVSGGTVDLGTTDIEYSNTGSALIEVSSGTLEVGGQVRRATTTTSGILKYRQTGGDVDIAVDGISTSDRAVFEVLNTGSEFTLTGGSFNLRRGVTGDANPSLELDPETFDLTGSTITIFDGLGADYGSNFFNIQSAIPLNNLTIANTVSLPEVQVYVLPLTVNNLDIQSNQVLISDLLDVTITGNLANAGTYTNNSGQTILTSSGGQELSGAGVFNIFDLVKQGAGSAITSVDLALNNDLRVEAGTLDIGSNTISLENDAYIESVLSNSSGNGLVFNGSAGQNLYGLANNTVSLGTLTINNINGVDIPDGNGYNFDITNELRLDGGVFNIGGSLVTMKTGSVLTEASTFNVNNMVQTNSSFTDNGFVIEFFGVASDTTLFFPVGELKYTPVQFEIDAGATTGSVRVRPANERHPAVVNNTEPMTETEIDDTQNCLQYYWVVVAENTTNVQGQATFFYDNDDILAVESDTSNFISARLLSNDTNWDKFAPTQFRGGNQTFIVPLDIGTGVSAAEITGDYTAGLGSSDGVNNDIEGALPDELAQYVSNFSGNGNYSTDGNWTAVGSSPVLSSGLGPVGAQVTISDGDVVTLDVSNIRIYSTTIEEGGTLIVPAGVTGDRLGNVSGSGTIVLTDTELLPTGEYSEFLACDGGALQYSGTTDYSVLSGISQIRKVTFEGTGTRTMPNNILTVCDTLIINGPTLSLISGQTYNIGDGVDDRMEIQNGNVTISSGSSVIINGDLIVSGGAVTGSSGAAIHLADDLNFSGGTINWNGTSILLNGDTEQVIDGDFTGSAAMEDLTINNSSSTGVTLNSGDVEVEGILTLTDGIVNTTSTESLTLTSSGDWTGASVASYISGPIGKQNIAVASTYQFPVGKNSRYAPASIANTGTGGQDWSAEYFTATGSFNSNSFDSSDPGSGFNAIQEVFSSDRWEIISSGSNSAQIQLAYGSHLGLSDEEDLRVVWWDGGESRWENQGGIIAGDATSGTATSENSIGFTTQQFGLALAPNIPLPVELIYFEGELTSNGVLLNWATASEIDNDRFEIERSVDGENFEVIGEVAGNGTTNKLINYDFLDDIPAIGLNYYRMRQVDYDGDFEYSPTILVDNRDGTIAFDARLFPNPTKRDNINLRLTTGDQNSEVTLLIYNMEGKVFFNDVFTAAEVISGVKLEQYTVMSAGLYLVQIRQAGQQKQLRLRIK